MQNSFFMQQAINEALKADPNKVYSNPLVGCVIVKNDKIIGRGYHKAFGTKHAEVNAIESLKNPVRDTDHYDYICQAVSNGIINISIKSHIPVLFGVLTCQNAQLAFERSRDNDFNKGFEVGNAAKSLLQSIG